MTATPAKVSKEWLAEIKKLSRFFPIFDHLADHLKSTGSLRGVNIGWHCHLTSLTAMALEALTAGGPRVFMSECNKETTDHQAVEYMKSLGATVYLGPQSTKNVIASGPAVLSDTGLDLIMKFITEPMGIVAGACEITTSGIARLRQLPEVPLPVVNINGGRIKSIIENFHGVGEGLIEALARLTGRNCSGSRIAVIGYGKVGQGAAHYLKRGGAAVSVVEADPVLLLQAHYDGFLVTPLSDALSASDVVVTATGRPHLLSKNEWLQCRDGLIVINLGHFNAEVSPEIVEDICIGSQAISEHLTEYRLTDGNGEKKVYLACGGNPANVVLLTGSAQPTLIHLTTEILCMELISARREAWPNGELPLPDSVEKTASLLALKALGLDECLPKSNSA